MEKKETTFLFRLAWGALLLIILIRVLPFLNPEGRYWGFNHLLYLPDLLVVVLFLSAIAGLTVPFIDKSGVSGEKLADGVNNFLYKHRRAVRNRIVFVLLAGVLFVVFAAPTHFLGDGYNAIVNISLGERTIVKPAEAGGICLVSGLARLLGGPDEGATILSFRIISILSGMITLYFIIMIAARIAVQPLIRLLALTAMIINGTLLLFFGYIEFYPVLWPLLTAYIWASLRYMQDGKNLWLVWLLLIAGLGLHLIIAIFIPSAVFLTFAVGRGQEIYTRYRAFIWVAAGAAVTVSIVAFIQIWKRSLLLEDMFLPPFEGKPSSPEYYAFSPRHLTDILNQLLLIFPLWPFFVVLALGGWRKIIRQKFAMFSLLIAAGSLAFLFVVDPKLGMPRDWDLFAMSAIGLILFMIPAGTEKNAVILKRMAGVIIIVSLFCTVPFLATNLAKSPSVNFAESLPNYETSRALSGLVVLQNYYKAEGNAEELRILRNKYNHRFGDKRKIDTILVSLNKGDLRTAERIMALLKPDKFNPDIYFAKAHYEFCLRRYDRALKNINNALQLRPWFNEYFCERALIYFATGEIDSALADQKTAYKLNPHSARVVNGLARIYADANMFDSSSRYARELIALDSTDPMAYYALVRQGVMQGDSLLVAENYDKFVRYADTLQHLLLIRKLETILSEKKPR